MPRTQYQAAIVSGDVAGAVKSRAAAEPSPFDHLVIYIAARRARERETADVELRAAIDALVNGTLEERIAAR